MNRSSRKSEKNVSGSIPDLVAKACAQLAQALSDPYQHTDYQTGEVSTRNALGFWQDKVLGGICFQLANGLDYTRATSMPRAKEAVQKAMRAHKGDELSEVGLQRALGWYQRLLEQEAVAQSALDEASYAYQKATGKAFSYTPRMAPNAGVNVVESPAMAAARALGIGGVNVAAGYTSADAIQHQPIERLPDATGRARDAAKKAAMARARKAAKAKPEASPLPDTAIAAAMEKAINGSAHG